MSGKILLSDANIYLNDGKGNPCAGQGKANSLETFRVKTRPSVARENFGFAPPIGSVYDNINLLFVQML